MADIKISVVNASTEGVVVDRNNGISCRTKVSHREVHFVVITMIKNSMPDILLLQSAG
jgi:hypothetical protein